MTTDVEAAQARFEARLEAHSGHEWRQVGPTVYCVPCGQWLYIGSIPAPERCMHCKTLWRAPLCPSCLERLKREQ